MFEEKRHYDNRLFSFITMYFTLLTISASVVSFIPESIRNNIVMILSTIQILAGVVVIISLYFNRVSYVKVCRQINTIRDFSLKNNAKSFAKNNIMPIDSCYPKYFKPDSLQFFIITLIICINSICIGILNFCIFNEISISMILVALSIICQSLINAFLLMKRDKNLRRKTCK